MIIVILGERSDADESACRRLTARVSQKCRS